MLNENQINLLPERIQERLNRINAEYFESVGKTLKKIGELRPSDVHRLQQAYNYGAEADRIAKKLSAASSKNIDEIYQIYDIVAKENYSYSEPFYKIKHKAFIPYNENKALQDYVKSLAKVTVNEYVNLCQTAAFAIFDKTGKSIAPLFESNKNKLATSLSDTYTKIVDYAVTKVQLGTDSYQTAIQEICKAMVNSGIKTVDYATGYSRRLDSAVRQNVLWGLKQCNQNSAEMIGEEFGADGYEVSYHSNPRESHADMAGKQFAKGKARTIDGVFYPSFEEKAKPLLEEYGCLHFYYPILLGVSAPAYSKEKLAAFKAEDNMTFEFDGKTYTKYEASQVQNALEHKMVTQKELANMAKVAGNDVLRREAQGNINLLTSKYNHFCKTSGLLTRVERMNVSGFRKVKTIDKSAENGIINILPGIDDAEISLAKFTEYALNPIKNADKAKAFEEALGYTLDNVDELIANIRENIKNFNAVEKPDNGYGIRYEILMTLVGANGKKANVKTAWIIDKNTGRTRLTSAYITKKKIKEGQK